MALHFQLMVNDRAIAWVVIRRREPVGNPDPDTTCVYDWQVHLADETILRNPPALPVLHRYGDGAFDLATRVLQAAGYAAGIGTPPRDGAS